jgi:hypothetical protein
LEAGLWANESKKGAQTDDCAQREKRICDSENGEASLALVLGHAVSILASASDNCGLGGEPNA